MKHTQVSSNGELAEALGEMAGPPRRAERGGPAGRPAELKTFILESREGFPPGAGDVSYDVAGTGMEAMKVLNVRYRESACEFFLDVSDKRFFKLHTNCSSSDARRIIGAMTDGRGGSLENAWFHRGMLRRIAKMEGNSLRGVGISYSDLVQDRGHLEGFLRVRGSPAGPPGEAVLRGGPTRRADAYKYVQIMRGAGRPVGQRSYDDVHRDGHLALRRGGSVQDHLHVVDQCKEEYSKAITGVEKERIYYRWKGGLGELHGNAFEFFFPNKAEDLDAFVERVFSATRPFQLWGLRQRMDDGRLKVLAVDLRAGSSVDFEIGHDMMRVYLFERGRGSIILRLLTNLQAYFDADTHCPAVDEIAG